MSSPDVFRSSPHRGSRPRQRSIHVEPESSSPGLPSVQEILSQKPSRPPIRSGSQAKPIPEGAASAFTTAREHWKSAQAAADQDDSVVVIDAPEECAPKARKPRKTKQSAKTAANTAPTEQSMTETEPWKKYKPSPQKGNAGKPVEDYGKEAEKKYAEPKEAATKKTGTMSKHFKDCQEPPKTEQPKVDADQPLELERAMERRADWTPPGSKQVDNSTVSSSAADEAHGAVFKTLLETYGCTDQPQREIATVSEEDSGFIKKRKLLELASPTRGSRSASPEKSPTKQKAPKKKPRTITALATAAYRPASQQGTVEPPGSLHEYFPNGTTESKEASEKAEAKAKPKGRKKPAKPSKKKTAPPKPVLLSPTTALTEVSKQDFVFGTSSQLVREHSPTMLHDLQAAIKNSTQANSDPFVEPLNSDTMEPVEPKRKLWEAAARDDDGQLFHAAFINLVDSSPGASPTGNGEDPFGYFKQDALPEVMESEPSAEGHSFETLSDILPAPVAQTDTQKSATTRTSKLEPQLGDDSAMTAAADASFEDLSDILPSNIRNASKDAPILVDEDSSFSSSQLSVSSDVRRKRNEPATSREKADEVQTIDDTTETAPSSNISRETPSQPNYDLYTDAQLSREITTYGFKPIKKRTAMISLLQQCWQSKKMHAPAGVRFLTTSTSQTTQKPEASPKRPRGRPRKSSISNSISQDPPPSGQVPESPKRTVGRAQKTSTSSRPAASSRTSEPPPSGQSVQSPKRPRGRPRKDSAGSVRGTSPIKEAKKSTAGTRASKTAKAPAAARLKTPPRKPKVAQTLIEIPDSASDNGSDLSVSPASSPEPMFSPSQQSVDLSVSMEEDAEQSLLLNPDEEEAALFKRIAQAVTTAPRSSDPLNPSWYEKILMYDPIVLEDLTAWLNAGQLTRVGHDGEIKPGDVKKWCESESLCCLWKVNLRGKERKRF